MSCEQESWSRYEVLSVKHPNAAYTLSMKYLGDVQAVDCVVYNRWVGLGNVATIDSLYARNACTATIGACTRRIHSAPYALGLVPRLPTWYSFIL